MFATWGNSIISAGGGAWVLPRISMWSPSWWKRFRKPSSWNIKMSSERIFQPQRSSGYSKTRVHLQKIWGWSLEMHQNSVQVSENPMNRWTRTEDLASILKSQQSLTVPTGLVISKKRTSPKVAVTSTFMSLILENMKVLIVWNYDL